MSVYICYLTLLISINLSFNKKIKNYKKIYNIIIYLMSK